MNRPNFQPIFTQKSDFCEQSSDKPVKTFVPGQAMKLSELMRRFEQGQRLNVHENFAPMSNFTRDSVYEETFDDAPPSDIHDIVDVHEYYKEHQHEIAEYKKLLKKKKETQQAQPSQPQAPQVPDDPAIKN